MENQVTIESLATVAGAVPATALIMQFIKLFWKGTNAVQRQMAALIATALVLGATVVINDAMTAGLWVAGVFGGITAGLAASQSYEVVTDGLGHTTVTDGDDSEGH